jgi:hypothetical protein
MGKRKFARDPLLYIQQPVIKTPEAQMQDQYMTPSKNKETESLPPPPQQQKTPVKRKTSYFKRELERGTPPASPPPENIEPAEAEEKEEKTEVDVQGDYPEKTKKFKDMSLEEKVNYLLYSPTHIPKMKCELRTEEKTYRGIITDFQENNVFIRVGAKSSSRQVPFDQITGIKMLGL